MTLKANEMAIEDMARRRRVPLPAGWRSELPNFPPRPTGAPIGLRTDEGGFIRTQYDAWWDEWFAAICAHFERLEVAA